MMINYYITIAGTRRSNNMSVMQENPDEIETDFLARHFLSGYVKFY